MKLVYNFSRGNIQIFILNLLADSARDSLIIRGHVKVVVGDGSYGARIMRERIWKEKGTLVLAPHHDGLAAPAS